MSRPLRIEFPGAVYHVTSRGNRREPIYRDEVDRGAQLDILAQAMDRFDQQQDMQIPKVQRLQTQSWSAWLTQCQGDRNQALYQAYQQGGMTMAQLSGASGLSMSHVSRLIAKGEKEKSETLRPLR